MSRLMPRLAAAFVWCAVLAAAALAAAQTSSPPADRISFDRPEAWAMKYFTSATSLAGLSVPDSTQPGSFEVGLEAGWLPTLSSTQERVGFQGTTPEDLNKAPVFLRPRVAIGLPRRLAIIAAFDPPMRAFGATPRLVAIGIDGIVHDSDAWQFAWRAHGQIGSVTAAVTCPSSVLQFAPGSPNNPAGCTSESADETKLRYAGIELRAARRLAHGVAPHVAAGVNLVDTVFQTNAQTYGEPDHTRLQTSGVTFAASAGLGYALNDRVAVAADVFYSPLMVRRPVNGGGSSNDPLINARALITYRVIR